MPSIALTRGVAGTAWSAVYSRPLQNSPRVYQTCGWCACVCVLRCAPVPLPAKLHQLQTEPICDLGEMLCKATLWSGIAGPGPTSHQICSLSQGSRANATKRLASWSPWCRAPTSNYIRKTGFRDVRRKRCNSCIACYTCERARGEGGCAADRRGRGWG